MSSLVGNYLNSAATMSTYLDSANVHFATGTLLASGLLDNQAALIPALVGAGAFSLTEVVTITAGPSSLTSLDAAIIDAPEPASLPLLGAGLLGPLGAGTLVRRRSPSPVPV